MRRTAGFPNLLGFLARRPSLTPTYSGSDLAAVALTAAVVALWVQAAGGAFSWLALCACEAVFLSFYLVGSLCAGWRPVATGALFDLPLRLLVGYAVVNTALLVLAWLSPFGIIANFGGLLVLAALLFVATRPRRQPRAEDSTGLLVIAVSLAAATLWCRDSLHPISVEGDTVLFKPWIDGFYHAVHLRIFGAGHGAASIEDFRMAGVPARLYHYGAYLTPALIKQASGIASYTAFAGILAPLGVFFTGLAAYALLGSFWGRWAGLAACVTLMLLPDGAQQGLGNTFMSYHWLTQISPSASYGLALLALAWLLVLLGCTQGSRLQVAAGWLMAGVLAAYKLHFFIASALLLLLFPALFFRGLTWRRRLVAVASALGVYVVAVVCLQKVPGVPPIRLDGSGMGKLFGLVVSFAQRGALREFVAGHLGPQQPWFANLLLGTPYVLLAALGVFAPLLGVLAFRQRARTSPALVLFPLLVVANFLVMFLGLALDLGSSTPDELSHRPVMVVYFVVVAWVGGAAGLWLLEARRLGRIARPAMVGAALVLMVVPARLGPGVQRMWSMRMFSPVRVPTAVVRVAEYMRDHGSPRDVFQHAQFDRTYTLAALSERRAYAARTMTIMRTNGDLLDERIGAIERFMELRDAAAVAATARELGLRWFVLDPSERVGWPAELADQPVFQADGYRLYGF